MHIICQVFGWIGSAFISVMFFPQVYTTFKTKDVEGLSISFLLLNTFVCICWIIYGIGFLLENDYFNSGTILIANTFVLFSTISLICAYKKYKN